MNSRREGLNNLSALSTSRIVLWILALALSLLAADTYSVQAQTDDEEISVRTNLVVLNLTVSDKDGKFVNGLKKSDFVVQEDGKTQEISLFSVEQTSFAAVILIDFSGSMEGRMALARAAAIRFLNGLRVDDTAAVYRFDSEIEQLQDFSGARDLAPVAFGRQANGQTVLYDAIAEAAAALAKRPEKRRAILIVSDGADTHSKISADKALTAALNANATIYAVDMADANASNKVPSAAGVLRNFAGKSGGRFVATPGGREMREAFAAMVNELSNQYTISYSPSNKAEDGRWRAIDVAVGSYPALTVRTRKGYKARNLKK